MNTEPFDLGKQQLKSLFSAAARLYRMEPWKAVPGGGYPLSVDIDALAVHDAALAVLGNGEEGFALAVFSNLNDFDAFLDAAEAGASDETVEVPRYVLIAFEPASELPPEVVEGFATNGWEVASDRAYPRFGMVEPDMSTLPLDEQRFALVQAILEALPRALANRATVRAAFEAGGDDFVYTTSVDTHVGSVDVTVAAPYTVAPLGYDPDHDLLGDLAALELDGSDFQELQRDRLESELLDRFIHANRADRSLEVGHVQILMDLAVNYIGHTVATLPATELEELLFDIIPRKVSMPAEEAGEFVRSNRAFYAYLKQEHGLKQADACLKVLTDASAKQLEDALADGDNFGMTKSLVMAASEAGYDLRSDRDAEAFMSAVNSGRLDSVLRTMDPELSAPRPTAVPKKTTKAKKKKRKEARKSKRKNR